ncbi:CDP-glycerol glycerophosphotransferase family protein [Pseudalkalibacillus sp. R45]
MFVFKMLFTIFKQFPQKDKVTFVASFGDNIYYAANALSNIYDSEIIILREPSCKVPFNTINNSKVYDFESPHLIHFLKSIYHLSTSRMVLVDNYFGFLDVTDFHPDVKCVQLWHAAGAIKKFGLMDPSIHKRSSSAKRRFKNVYGRFTHIVVGSEKMVDIFKESFGAVEQKILRTGIPRTDFFFDKAKHETAVNILTNEFPIIKTKKVILYAPTFREGEFDLSDIPLDLKKMREELSDDYVVFLRLHPAVNFNLSRRFPGFVYDVTDHHSMNHLLLITDYLITDYSSIPFEYSLLGKPMIFYAYDLKEYQKERGFWEEYNNNIPGPIATNTNDIITFILNNNFDLKKINDFAFIWNQYSNGNSSEALIEELYK